MPKDNTNNNSVPTPFPSVDESVSVVIPTTQQSTPSQPQGNQTDPSFDIPTIVSSKPKSKFGGKKLAATIVGTLLLVGGISAGVILVGQRQDIREKAYSGDVGIQADCNGFTLSFSAQFDGGYVSAEFAESASGSWRDLQRHDLNEQRTGTVTFSYDPNPPSYARQVRIKVFEVERNDEDEIKVVTLPLNCEQSTIRCLNITAWDTDWVSITASDLTQLQEGDVVRFVVAGQASSGTFDKARFTINDTQLPETTAVRPGTTNEFYTEYTVPAETTSFTVSAQIHHVETDTWY